MAEEEVIAQLVIDGLADFLNGMRDASESTDDLGTSADKSSGLLDALGGVMTGVADIAKTGLAVAVGAVTAGLAAFSAGLAYSVGQAMEAQEVEAQLDAVLRSTGAAAAESAAEYEAAQGKYVTSTRASASQIADWQDKLVRAQAKLTDLQNRLVDKEPTETQKIQLSDLSATVADLTAKIQSGGDTVTTSLVKALGLLPPVVRPTKQELLALANELQNVTRFSDETVISVESMLLTFTKIGKDVFPRATETALDMAQVFGSADSASVQLGKALNDPITGITALTRVGVTFSEEQKKLIKSLVDTGDIAGAQTVILDELATEFGGSARAAGETFGGQLDILRNRLSNVAETIGLAILPVLQNLFNNVIAPALPIIEALGSAFATAISAFASGEENIGGVFRILGSAVDNILPGAYTWFLQIGRGVQDVVNAMGELWPVIQNELLPALGNLFVAITGQAPTTEDVITSLLTAIVNGVNSAASFIRDTLIPAVQEFAAWSNENLVPALADIRTWLQTNIPAAIQVVTNFWNNTLSPALAAFSDWVQSTLIPTMLDMKTWLDTNLPVAIQFLTDAWNNVIYPALVAIDSWVQGTLIPTLSLLWDWVQTNLPAAIQTLTDFWNNTLLPALTTIWNFISVSLIPLITELSRLIGEVLRLEWEKYVQQYNEEVAPALSALWSFIKDNIMPIIDSFTRNELTKFSAGFDLLKLAIKAVTEWIGKLADALAGVQIPPELTPGSPTPFELGLRGIGKAARSLTGDLVPLARNLAGMDGTDIGIGFSSSGAAGATMQRIATLYVERLEAASIMVGSAQQPPVADTTGARYLGPPGASKTINFTANYQRAAEPPSIMSDLSLAMAVL